MPIEFRCTGCGKLLRTPDNTGGKQARCPECGTVLAIPTVAPETMAAAQTLTQSALPQNTLPQSTQPQGTPPRVKAPGARGTATPVPPGSANPYQAPAIIDDAKEPIAAGKLQFGEVYRRAWKIFRQRAALCVAIVAISLALNYLLAFSLLPVRAEITRAGVPRNVELAIWCIVAILFQWWITSGQTYFFLNLAGGRPAKFTDLFAGGRWFLRVTAATLLFFVVFVIGWVLLFVPGIIIGLMWSQYIYLIIDRDLGILASLRTSREIMRGNKLTLLGIYLVTLLPAMIASIATAFTMPGVPWRNQILPQLAFTAFMPWFNVLAAVCHLTVTGKLPIEDTTTQPQGE